MSIKIVDIHFGVMKIPIPSLAAESLWPGAARDPKPTGHTFWRPGLDLCADTSRKILRGVINLPKVGRGSTKARAAVSPTADPLKLIWVRPDEVIFKIKDNDELRVSQILPGDWDLRRARLVQTIKHRSIVQRYLEGREWQDTDLFRRYAQRFSREQIIRGVDSIASLARQYEARVDDLYRDLGASGFRIVRDTAGHPINVPYVHVGRDGSILWGIRGNHRLAMSKLLSVALIPCHVYTRHANWQEIRHILASGEPRGAFETYRRRFSHHPDLADLLYPDK